MLRAAVSRLKPVIYSTLSSFALLSRFPDESASILNLLYNTCKDNLLVIAILTIAFARLYKREPQRYLASVFVALLFSASIVIGRAFLIRQDFGGSYTYGSLHPIMCNKSHVAYSMLMFLGLYILSKSAINEAYSALSKICSTSNEKCVGLSTSSQAPQNTIFNEVDVNDGITARLDCLLSKPIATMALLCLLWLPYVVVLFPGCIHHDAADQICQYFGYEELTSHHPIITTYIFGFVISIGRAFGNDAFGVFLVTVLQVTTLSYACARIIERVSLILGEATINRANGKSLILQTGSKFLLLAFFGLTPMFGSAVTSIKKDCLFYAAFTLFTLACAEAALPRRGMSCPHTAARIILWGSLTALIRNDGILFVMMEAACVILTLTAGRHRRHRPMRGQSKNTDTPTKQFQKLAISFLTITLIYSVGYRGLAMHCINVKSGSIGEALTIPIQQVARFYTEAPEDVDNAIREGVSRLLDESALNADVYDPMISDNIKFNYFKEDCTVSDLVAFTASYIRAGIKRPDIYASALIDQTLGWWYIEQAGYPDKVIAGMGLYQNVPKTSIYSNVLDFQMPFLDTPVMAIFRRLLMAFSYIPILGLLTYPPIYLWTLILFFSWAVSQRNRTVIMMLPLIGYYAICLASPVGGLLRYVIPVAITLPPAIASIIINESCEAKPISCKKINAK